MFYEKLAEAKDKKKQQNEDTKRRFQLMAATGALGLTGAGLMLRKKFKANKQAIDATRTKAKEFKETAEAMRENTEKIRQQGGKAVEELRDSVNASNLLAQAQAQGAFDEMMLDPSKTFLL